LPATVYGLAMVGHLKNVSPTFAQKPNRITNVAYTVSPTIAKPMLAVRCFSVFFYALIIVKMYETIKQRNVIVIPVNGILNQYFFANQT
jgi:hypothetical protein